MVVLLRDLIHDRIGIHFELSRLPSMLDKLEPRARARGCRSYLDYYYLLKYDAEGAQEWRRVMDAFSVQETYFWREADQLRYLVEQIVPAWFRGRSEPLRIWSAACATGEEPYSIAMALDAAGYGAHPIEILASDASEAALEKARAAEYRERSFRSIPKGWRERYFERRGEISLLRPEIRERVQFRWANLLDLPTDAAWRGFPVIFCRNVFIYFSPDTITRTANEIAGRMRPGGALFIGASESLLKLTDRFELRDVQGTFAYMLPAAAA